MNHTDIEKILADGESETVEFKESFSRETVQTGGAFANTRGGTILIGVSDNGDVVGVQLGQSTLNDWVNTFSQSTNNHIIPEIESINYQNKDIVRFLIREYPLKPVAVRGRCYRRVGRSNRVLTPQEIADIQLQSRGMSWDKLQHSSSTVNDIDMEKVQAYISRANEFGRKSFLKSESPRQVLDKLEFIQNGKPTWAALLLFGKSTYQILPQAAMHCGRFKSETEVVDDRLIQGTLIEQIDETMNFIQKHISVKFVMTGKPERTQVWDIPLEALREAVINAICHRDYTILSNTDIRIFDEHLIIWNPGGLPAGLALQDLYKPHSSSLRNMGIAEVLYDIGYIERWGTGIDKMRKACTAQGLPEPVLKDEQGLLVRFEKDIYREEYLRDFGFEESQIQAIKYIKEKGKITNKEYRSLTGLSDESSRKHLNALVMFELLRRKGKGRGTYYVLKKYGDFGD